MKTVNFKRCFGWGATFGMRSLKMRLILFFTLICCVVFAAAAFVSWHETREKIDEFFDTYQMALARQLSSANWRFVGADEQAKTDRLIDGIDDADDEDEAIGFAVFDTDGTMVFHDDENGRDFSYNPMPGRFVTQNVDGEKWRIVWLASADGQYVIAVGQELEYRQDIVWDMMEEFLMPWGIGLVLLLAAMILIVMAEFSSINRLAHHLSRRRDDDLSALEDRALPSEIKPLTHAMNGVLKKIERLLERERGFIADSAHELRSPLTALKVQLEVMQLSENDEKTRNEALKKLHAGIDRAARLAEQLLALSKAESSFRSEADERIYWDDIVTTLLEEYAAPAREKNMQLTFSSDKTGPFETGNALLASLIVRNLLDNAVKYSPDGALVSLVLKDKSLTVVNSQTVVPEKYLARLGQRFYRPAGQKQTGSGLGLSIVARICALNHCMLKCRNTPDGFEVSVCGKSDG